uniref:Odorant receptor n=1 Tax=Culex quinquefasciatus TaxID=7176 RepID=A0A1S4K5A7_CULQU
MELFRKARLAKSRLDKLVDKDPFWLLDRYLILAGARFTPRNRWQRIGWLLYQFVTYSNLTIALVCFISAVIFEEDSVKVIRTFLIFVTMSLSLYKQHWLLQNRAGIGRLRNLLETHEFCSGDVDFDESARKRFKRTSRMLIITISWIITLQQILSWIPSDTQGIIFEIPSWIAWCWGERVSLVIQVWYLSICVTIWCFKLYGCTVTAVTLMVGYEAEQRMLAHKFGQIQYDLQELRQNYWDCELARKQYWERLGTLVRVSFNQQQLLLRHLKDLQSLVQTLFVSIYYIALFLYGSDLFIVMNHPSVAMYIIVAGTAIISSLECFSLCYLVDSLRDVFESISRHMFYLCARLPYSEDHHNDYLDMRVTLQIIAMCSRNAVTFGCAGVSEISIAVFTDMLNTCFSVFTFLRKMV